MSEGSGAIDHKKREQQKAYEYHKSLIDRISEQDCIIGNKNREIKILEVGIEEVIKLLQGALTYDDDTPCEYFSLENYQQTTIKAINKLDERQAREEEGDNERSKEGS